MSEVEFIHLRGPLDLVRESPSRVVDTVGMVCPYPSFEASKAIADLRPGEVIEIITDSDISARESIPTVLDRHGLNYIVYRSGELWHIKAVKPP
jgi:TusA-related sulfurtransferase